LPTEFKVTVEPYLKLQSLGFIWRIHPRIKCTTDSLKLWHQNARKFRKISNEPVVSEKAGETAAALSLSLSLDHAHMAIAECNARSLALDNSIQLGRQRPDRPTPPAATGQQLLAYPAPQQREQHPLTWKGVLGPFLNRPTMPSYIAFACIEYMPVRTPSDPTKIHTVLESFFFNLRIHA